MAKCKIEHKLRMRARRAKRQQWAIDLENERRAREEFEQMRKQYDEPEPLPIPK